MLEPRVLNKHRTGDSIDNAEPCSPKCFNLAIPVEPNGIKFCHLTCFSTSLTCWYEMEQLPNCDNVHYTYRDLEDYLEMQNTENEWLIVRKTSKEENRAKTLECCLTEHLKMKKLKNKSFVLERMASSKSITRTKSSTLLQ